MFRGRERQESNHGADPARADRLRSGHHDGKPTIKGTRITVELILSKLGEGMSMAELLEAYPHLTSDDVRAALSFAADYLRNEDIQFGQPEAA